MLPIPTTQEKEGKLYDDSKPPPLPPKAMGGLKRMTGSTRVQPSIMKETPAFDVSVNKNEEPTKISSFLNHQWLPSSLSFVNIFAAKSDASTSDEKQVNPVLPPRSHLTRTKTSNGPLKIMPQATPATSNKYLCSSKSVANLKSDVVTNSLTPGGKHSKVTSKRKGLFEPMNEEASTPTSSVEIRANNSDKVTPPMVIRRTNSGSMLLRQTPERMRRIEETPTKSLFRSSSPSRMKRAGSASRIETPVIIPKDAKKIPLLIRESATAQNVTPTYKRKRTSSASLLPSTPTSISSSVSKNSQSRLRPRRISESLEDNQSNLRISASPMKKKARKSSISSLDMTELENSVSKKRCISSVTIRLQDSVDLTPSCITPTGVPKSLKKFHYDKKLINEETEESKDDTVILQDKEAPDDNLKCKNPPEVRHLSSSGQSYHSVASNGTPFVSCFPSDISSISSSEGDIFVTARSSLTSNPDQETSEPTTSETRMVPLVKKQVSIDETKLIEEDEDEGFGDSTKTIKRGQGNHLARSVSLKLMPKREEPKMLKNDAEKCSSTPSLPTAPLIRQSSMSSLRFKVSPSTFLKPQEAPKPIIVASSEPSTSKPENENKVITCSSIKSVLKNISSDGNVQKEAKTLERSNRKRVKFEGINVFYFDRMQGHSTVPTDGEVSLDMENEHHAKRYFPFTTFRRPILDLALYDDEDLSDGEVVVPDSEDEHDDDDNYQSAKSIPRIVPSIRIEILAKSGVQFKKSTSVSAKVLRKNRSDCGCKCSNGVCIPETCLCSVNGIQCQIDGGENPNFPCGCHQEFCTNPNGRIFYDYDAVQEHRKRVIMLHEASKKTGISGYPVVKKFVDSDDEDEEQKNKSAKVIKTMKLEESPTRYPVTPIYTRRSRCLSDIRESNSENVATCSSLSERMKGLERLDNDVCIEEDEELNMSHNDTIVDADATVQELDSIVLESDSADSSTSSEPVKMDDMMRSPVKDVPTTTLVV